MRKKLLLGVLFVFLLVVGTAMAVSTQGSNKYIDVTVKQPNVLKTNALNNFVIELDPRTSYPVNAKVVVYSQYFVIRPEWVQGANAMRDGTGITFTLFDMTEEKEVKIVIPGTVLEDIKIDEEDAVMTVRVNAHPSASAIHEGISAQSYDVLTLSVVGSSISYENWSEALFPILLVVLGVVLSYFGARFLQA